LMAVSCLIHANSSTSRLSKQMCLRIDLPYSARVAKYTTPATASMPHKLHYGRAGRLSSPVLKPVRKSCSHWRVQNWRAQKLHRYNLNHTLV
jgi:hypothetical protein